MLRLEVLSMEEMNLVHESAVEILEKTGIVMQDDHILKLFAEAGAEVNEKEQTVKIPAHLIKECLKKTPKHVTLSL